MLLVPQGLLSPLGILGAGECLLQVVPVLFRMRLKPLLALKKFLRFLLLFGLHVTVGSKFLVIRPGGV